MLRAADLFLLGPSCPGGSPSATARLPGIGAVLVLGLTVALVGLPPSLARAEEKPLFVLNWYEYIGPDVIPAFEAETGVPVTYDVYEHPETMKTKVMVGNSEYDVVIAENQAASDLMKGGAIQPIDPDRLENYGNLDPVFLRHLDTQDGGRSVGVPYTWATAGVSYNVDMVESRVGTVPDNALDLVFDPDHADRLKDCGIAGIDAPQSMLALALLYLDRDPFSNAPEDLAAAEALWEPIRPAFAHFNSGRLIQDLAGGDICVAITWNGDAGLASAAAADSGSDARIVYRIPTSGTLMLVDLMTIPADSDNVEGAYRFIDYILRPEVIAQTSNHIYFANANAAALPYVSEDVRSDPNIYPPPAVMDRLVLDRPLSAEVRRARQRVWTRIKTGL